MLRIISKLLVLILTLFAIFLGICALLGIQIYFPFNVAEGKEIPYHRMQSVRVAVLYGPFTFYGCLYLINSIKEVFPIHFLKVFMISFGITSLIFSIKGERRDNRNNYCDFLLNVWIDFLLSFKTRNKKVLYLIIWRA